MPCCRKPSGAATGRRRRRQRPRRGRGVNRAHAVRAGPGGGGNGRSAGRGRDPRDRSEEPAGGGAREPRAGVHGAQLVSFPGLHEMQRNLPMVQF